jgi:hypothetical protein
MIAQFSIMYHRFSTGVRLSSVSYLGLKKCQPKKTTPRNAQTQPMMIQAKPINGFLSPKKDVPVMTIDFVPP